MAIPLKVLNRLRLGRDVAAKVDPTWLDHLAWVYVYPILNPENGYLLRGHRGEERIVSSGSANPIKGYLVRHLEVEAKVAEDYLQSIRDDIGKSSFDTKMIVADEQELEKVLAQWLSDFTALHVPTSVDYYFELGPDLID